MRTERPFWALSVLAVCLLAVPAAGLSIDQSPRPTILLRKSDRFIAMKAWNSVGLVFIRIGAEVAVYCDDFRCLLRAQYGLATQLRRRK